MFLTYATEDSLFLTAALLSLGLLESLRLFSNMYLLHAGIHKSSFFLYICSSVHRNSRLKESNKMQQYADVYLLLNYCTCFGHPLHPSLGVHKNVVAASGTDHTVWEAASQIV